MHALAASLRRNATLRALDFSRANLASEELHLVFSALGGCAENPSLCGLVSLTATRTPLDRLACEALGRSLARGAKLEVLIAEGCSIGPEGAAAIADGIAGAGRASRLRSLNLDFNQIGLKGALPACAVDCNRVDFSCFLRGLLVS